MKKNVLLIVADQFRADCLGAAGNPIIKTPNLDALAAEGVLFKKCFVQCSPCGPSRMSIYTGRYLCSTGALDNETPLAEAENNIALHLRNHGMDVALIGYNDYAIDPRILPEGDPKKTALHYKDFLPGFDVALDHAYGSQEWFDHLRSKGYPESLCSHDTVHNPNVPAEGPGDRLPISYSAQYSAEDSDTQFMTSKAIKHISARPEGGWFLSLNYLKPHEPNLCPAPYHAMYDPDGFPSACKRPDEASVPHPYLDRMQLNSPERGLDEHTWGEFRACYYGMISELDASLGRLFDALKEEGVWDDTLIIFSSDHGNHLGDHSLMEKAHYFDSNMRVPYILRDPSRKADVTRGSQLDVFCEAIDTVPTICEFLELPVLERAQGRGLLDHVHGSPDARAKKWVFHEYYYFNSLLWSEQQETNPDECRLWVVRDDDYKYVQFGEESMPPMLFDMRQDPEEFVNLAGRPECQAVVARYCQHLIRWRIRNEDNRMEGWARTYR